MPRTEYGCSTRSQRTCLHPLRNPQDLSLLGTASRRSALRENRRFACAETIERTFRITSTAHSRRRDQRLRPAVQRKREFSHLFHCRITNLRVRPKPLNTTEMKTRIPTSFRSRQRSWLLFTSIFVCLSLSPAILAQRLTPPLSPIPASTPLPTATPTPTPTPH